MTFCKLCREEFLDSPIPCLVSAITFLFLCKTMTTCQIYQWNNNLQSSDLIWSYDCKFRWIDEFSNYVAKRLPGALYRGIPHYTKINCKCHCTEQQTIAFSRCGWIFTAAWNSAAYKIGHVQGNLTSTDNEKGLFWQLQFLDIFTRVWSCFIGKSKVPFPCFSYIFRKDWD